MGAPVVLRWMASALLSVLLAFHAPPAHATDGVVARACDEHGRQVEQTLRLPDGLLRAIGRAESSRRDPDSGVFAPWPWTINAAGQGRHFDTKAAAADAIRALQRDGTASVDVGCFQVNLLHHPQAFQSIEDGLEPALNAAYAGIFLQELRSRTGSWEGAVAAYHSATPERGDAYRARVYAIWQGRGGASVAPAAGWVTRTRPVVIRIAGPDVPDPGAAVQVWAPALRGGAPSRISVPQVIAMPAALVSATGGALAARR